MVCSDRLFCVISSNIIIFGLLGCVIINAGVYLYENNEKVGHQLAEMYRAVYIAYTNTGDQNLASILKLFHSALDCCGIGMPLEPFVRDTCPNKGLIQIFTTPQCPVVIETLLRSHAPLILGFFIITAIVMVLTSICSCLLSEVISCCFSLHTPAHLLS